MTNTTTATVIEMVINAGVKTAAEIEAFVTGLGRNVTVSMVDEALTELTVAHTTKMTKAVKINLFARALEMDIDDEDFVADMESLRGPVTETVEVNGVVGQLSAAGETLVAETNQKEEDVKMMSEQEQINYRNQKALKNSAVLKKGAMTMDVKTRIGGLTNEVQAMLDGANNAKDEYFRSIGDFGVRVENIWFYAEKAEATREEVRAGKYVRHSEGTNKDGRKWEQTIIGEVTVRMPKDYAQIKFFNRKKPNPKNGKMGAVEWLDFNGYDAEGNRVAYDADFTKPRNNSRKPAEGKGYIVLPIKLGKDGKPRVNLPVDPDMNGGRPWPVFKTADVRYINTKNATRKDESMFVADNNSWFNAQVTAYIQVFTGEFVQQDVRNIHAISKLCTTCAHSVRLFQRDEVNGDLDTSRKSRSVLNPLSILELAQVGGNLPSVVCGLTQKFVDVEATLELNEAEQFEKTEYRDADGRIRYVGHNQVMIKGEAINKFDFRAQGTKGAAEDCVNYHGNTPKSEAKVAAERASLREQGKSDYVSPFYKELPQVERQFIQTLVMVEGKKIWVPKFPGEVEKPLAVRVKSAGLTVYGAPHVFKYADKGFVAPVMEEDVRHNDVMDKINQIFYAAFNMWKLDESQAEAIFELADNKPEGLTDSEDAKWDLAVYWLAQAIIRAQEREEARKYEAFAPHFFTTDDVVLQYENEDGTVTEEKAELTEIEVDWVMGETMSREDEIGYGLGYKDLLPTEFSRYLNDSALDYVYRVITNGERFVVVAGEEGDAKDVELAAGALQHMLQIELTQNYYVFADGQRRDASLVSNVKKDADPAAALANLNACDEVKDYIAELAGLNK
jgi:hypothetical protein